SHGSHGGVHGRPRRQEGDRCTRNGRPSHADRVAPRRDPRAPSGQAGEPAPAPAGGLGASVRGGDELPSRVHGADPPEAGTGAGPAALFHHRAGDGIPIRTGRLMGRVSPRRSPRGASALIPAPPARPARRPPRARFPAVGSPRGPHAGPPRSSSPVAGAVRRGPCLPRATLPS